MATDTDIIERFVDWLRTEGYYMKKVNEVGNEAFVPTYDLIEAYRLAGGLGKAAMKEPVPEEPLF